MATLKFVPFALVLLFAFGIGEAHALSYTPTTFTDPPVSGAGVSVNIGNGVITGGAGNGLVSLRSATVAANSNPGSTINLLAGTYQLTIAGDANDRNWTGTLITDKFNPNIGDLDIYPAGITINGAGAALTTIQQTTGGDRIITVNPNATPGAAYTFTLSNLTMKGGRDGSANHGGAAIFLGAKDNVGNITNCVFVDNKVTSVNGSLGGGAVQNTGGNLTVTNCTFGGVGANDPNTSTTSGGALGYDSSDFVNPMGSGTLTVTGCTFINNVANSAAAGGGAIQISDSNLSSATANISNSTFTGNKAPTAAGGAIVCESGILTVTKCTFVNNQALSAGGAIFGSGTGTTANFNRFIGHTANSGKTLNAQTATFNANDNWWGQNGGPLAGDITANVTVANFLQDKLTAGATTIVPNGSTSLTASFLSDSANNVISTANLAVIIGQPITFTGGNFGSISSPQTTVQASGTTTATFNAGPIAGISTVTAQVDNLPGATTAITIPVSVTSSTAALAASATSMTIAGNGFDNITPANNTVVFNNGATGTVTAATNTQLTVTSLTGLVSGSLTAVVTTNSVSSGAPVQVATVFPVVTTSTANLAATATTITINGFGFSTTPANNTVAFSGSVTGTVTASTKTQLTVTSLSGLVGGSLTAIVTSNGQNSGAAVQVATVLPVVTSSTANLAATATGMTINGFGFSSTPANNTVSFSGGVTGTVTASTATTLTISSLTGLTGGALNASVTTNGASSGAAVQVATVVPVVTASTANLAANATSIVINGFGFSSTPANNTVVFNDSATGSVTAASATSITVTFGTKPANAGSLTAVVTTNGMGSGAAVQVATVIPVITPNSAVLALNATTTTINGFGFSATPANNVVAFSNGVTGTVTASSATQLTVSSLSGLVGGNLTASVTSNGVSSGAAVQVATVLPVVTSSAANLGANATSITINGLGFSTTPANNVVTFSGGATGTVTAATKTQLTVTSLAGLTVGILNASVTVNSVSTGAAVQVANVIPVVTPNNGSLATTATTLTIAGFGFSTTPANNAVTFNGGVTGSVTAATSTQLTITGLTGLSVGSLTAVVTVSGVSSGAPVQVANVQVDTVAPTITSVTPPANGSYHAGQSLDFTVNTSENVIVSTAGGTPSLSLVIGASAKNAAYVSGGGTSALLFRYTVSAGDTDTDGIATVSPLALNGGSMADAAGNAAVLTFTLPNTTGVLVDTTAPTISGTVANQPLNDNATIQPFSNVTIDDVGSPAPTLTVAFTVSDTAKGSITILNGFTDAGGGTFTFSGTAATATSAIRGVVFTPVNNAIPLGQPALEKFTLTADNAFTPLVTDNTTSVVITPVNDPPLLLSGPAAMPNPAAVDQTVAFSASAIDPDGDTLTFTWNFGDGTNGSGGSTTHAYLTSGTFNVVVTVADGRAPAVTASIQVFVNEVVGSGPDADGDGFSDTLEGIAGTNPEDPTSTPIGGAPATPAATQPLTIAKSSIKLNFTKQAPGDKHADTITFGGTVPVPTNFVVENQKVVIDVGGAAATFTLDKKGSSKTPVGTVKVTVKAKKGVVSAQTSKYTVTLSKGAFAAALADEGLVGTVDIKKPAKSVQVLTTVIFNNTILQKMQVLDYTARKDKSGAAKSPRK